MLISASEKRRGSQVLIDNPSPDSFVEAYNDLRSDELIHRYHHPVTSRHHLESPKLDIMNNHIRRNSASRTDVALPPQGEA